MSVAGFFATMLGTMLDPVGLVGYILAGIFIRGIWWVLLAAAAWAAVMTVLVQAITATLTPAEIWGLFPARLVGALFVTGVTYWIASAVRKSKKAKLAAETAQDKAED